MSSNTQQPSIPPVPQDGGDFPLVESLMDAMKEALIASIANQGNIYFVNLWYELCEECQQESVTQFKVTFTEHLGGMVDIAMSGPICAIAYRGSFLREPPGWTEHKLRFYAASGGVH